MGSHYYGGTMKAAAGAVAGAVWTVVMAFLVGPAAYASLSGWLPRAYVALSGWLTPPYLYLVINGIILSIAASSRFHLGQSDPEKAQPVPVQLPDRAPVPESGTDVAADPAEERGEEEFVISGRRLSFDTEGEAPEYYAPAVLYSGEAEVPPEYSVPAELRTEYSEAMEKPLVSARFGHRKSIKPSPDGKALRVARLRKGETLESTWRTITEGRHVPLTRHLKKSDTWDTRRSSGDFSPSPVPAMRKAETFHERAAGSGGGGEESLAAVSGGGGSGGRVKREPSIGQDELNRRVEAFIKKFNDEMRLQRQESFKHYMDMINRGAGQ